jgi:hypothetical protein
MYTQVVYCLDRVPDVMAKNPELKNREPFKTVLSGNREAIARLPLRDLEKILAATLSGKTVEEFNGAASSCSNSILQSDVHAGGLLPRPRAGRGGEEAGAQE